MRVKLTVTGECGTVLGVYYDAIEEKYPFWCDDCEEYHRIGSYPWSLKAEIVDTDSPPPAAPPTDPPAHERAG